MEMLAVLLLIIILFVLISLKSSMNHNYRKIENELNDLKRVIANSTRESKVPVSHELVETQPKKEPIIKKDYWESGFKVQEESAPQHLVQPEPVKQHEPYSAKGQSTNESPPRKTIQAKDIITPPGKLPEPVRKPSFFEQHPDIEKFIGENLISKIGIAILVLAIGYFVKYAIDKNWIGPVARVSIGILCGGILILLAHRLRRNYKAFSSVLVGGGLAVLYFTIALAYHQFHLFSQALSFVIMVVITAFAVTLSMLYNRQELAIIALVGGFATPFLVSEGSGNFKALFTYLLVLNTGLLVIAYNKTWRVLNSLAFAFTVLLFLVWLVELRPGVPRETYLYGFLFATTFYFLFFIINIANNVKENKQFIASDFSILLANTALYFSSGLYFIHAMGADEYRGLFTAVLGATNLGASMLLFRKQKVDPNIFYLLIGITVSFVSLTAPIQLKGNYITLFWASECVLLYWLYQRSKIHIIQLASLIVWVAMVISLLIDWVQFYSLAVNASPILLNKGFITTAYAAACSYLLVMLRKKDLTENTRLTFNLLIENILKLSVLVLFFMAGFLEINHQYSLRFPGTEVKLQYILLYTYLFVISVSYIRNSNTKREKSYGYKYLLLTCLIIYLFSIPESFAFLREVLSERTLSTHIIAHWAGILVLAVIYFSVVQIVRSSSITSKSNSLLAGLLCSWIVIYLSVEVNLAAQSVFFDGPASLHNINQTYVKSGLPILWGLCSFAFMWLGMKHKYRPLRIISLVLFLITLIKLFAFDIRNISAGGKIAAFFCLGVLLLIISFMYQRLKQIIIQDADKPVV